MRVALLLSGDIRDSVELFPFWKENLLNIYNPDIFLSTWNTKYINEFIDIFNPVSTIIDNYDSGFSNLWKTAVSPYEYKLETNANLVSCYSMWYRAKSVNEIMHRYENLLNLKYDIVIKTRPDLQIYDIPKIDDVNSKSLYIPRGWDWSEGINDLIAWGNSESIDYYCNLFVNFIETVKDMNRLNPERILKSWLGKSSLEIKRPEVGMALRDMDIKSTYWFSD
jgi:hypothetical protein